MVLSRTSHLQKPGSGGLNEVSKRLRRYKLIARHLNALLPLWLSAQDTFPLQSLFLCSLWARHLKTCASSRNQIQPSGKSINLISPHLVSLFHRQENIPIPRLSQLQLNDWHSSRIIISTQIHILNSRDPIRHNSRAYIGITIRSPNHSRGFGIRELDSLSPGGVGGLVSPGFDGCG
jgi:hypothetical protein